MHFCNHEIGTSVRSRGFSPPASGSSGAKRLSELHRGPGFSRPGISAYARIRADLKRLGSAVEAKIGANDLFIAAHARSLGLTLVTNNTREFGRVSRLVIENWTVGA